MNKESPGRVLTFYSYKGGTGRSMALANVAWILASNGKRVLVVDWDLEAPGLHRYFYPFLQDKKLEFSEGIIDIVTSFALKATTTDKSELNSDNWHVPIANIRRYATSLDFNFSDEGTLDFIPAGRQDSSYSTRVNSFDWKNFYERLGGSHFLDEIKKSMKSHYDFILIDSRTGVSDTSGICTIKMSDDIVICFTLNNQSIEGAAAVANSVEQQRGGIVRIFPIRTRVEFAEKAKLDKMREVSGKRFNRFLRELEPEKYWGQMEIAYQPFYAYEEILATIADKPGPTNSILASMERLSAILTDSEITKLGEIDEAERQKILDDFLQVLEVDKDADIASDTGRSPVSPVGITPFEFVTYSSTDTSEFVLKLADALANGTPTFPVWLDKQSLRSNDNVASQIAEAIRLCDSVIYVMSANSVTDDSDCMLQLAKALRYKKTIIPIRLTKNIEMPVRLGSRQSIDFTVDFDTGLASLRNHLLWLSTPEGQIQILRDRLADALREQRRTTNTRDIQRIADEIVLLNQQIVGYEYAVAHSESSHKLHLTKVKSFVGHQDAIWGVTFLPNGKRVVSASNDGTLRMWDLQTGELRQIYQGHEDAVLGVAITMDGRFVSSGSQDKSLIKWDVETGRSIQQMIGHNDSVTNITVTPDNRYLVSASIDKTIKIWDWSSGTEVRTLEGHTLGVNMVVVTPSGKSIISGSADDTVRIWDFERGNQLCSYSVQQPTALVITSDEQFMICATAESKIYVWPLSKLEPPRILLGHDQYVWGVGLVDNGRHLISIAADGKVNLWNLSSGDLITTEDIGEPLNSCAVAADGLSIIVGSNSGTLHHLQIQRS